jgi:hypothetical protein
MKRAHDAREPLTTSHGLWQVYSVICTHQGGFMAAKEKALKERIQELEETLADIRDQINAILGDEDEIDEEDYVDADDEDDEEEEDEEEEDEEK